MKKLDIFEILSLTTIILALSTILMFLFLTDSFVKIESKKIVKKYSITNGNYFSRYDRFYFIYNDRSINEVSHKQYFSHKEGDNVYIENGIIY